ncbi:MAG: hypothetical protein ACRYGP_27850 [Janthinobacterium lividum]
MTYFPIAPDRTVSAAPTEGLFTRMIRLWIEHYQRVIDLGIRPH